MPRDIELYKEIMRKTKGKIEHTDIYTFPDIKDKNRWGIDCDTLYQSYWKKEPAWSQADIAKHYELKTGLSCSPHTISLLMRKCGIKRRTKSEALLTAWQCKLKFIEQPKVLKEAWARDKEARIEKLRTTFAIKPKKKVTDEVWEKIRHLYFDKEYTQNEIGEMLDISRTTMQRAFIEHEAEGRDAFDSQKIKLKRFCKKKAPCDWLKIELQNKSVEAINKEIRIGLTTLKKCIELCK